MDPRLSSLVELQDVLSEQRVIEKQYSGIPERKREIEDELQEVKDLISSLEERSKEYELEHRSKEQDLQDNQVSRVKKEAQVHSIKNEKELQALTSEIESLDRRNSRSEERIIELLDLIEKDNEELETSRKKLSSKEEAYSDELKDLNEREASLVDRVNQARATTESYKEQLNTTLFTRFLKIFDNKNGIAITSANDGHCGACNMRLTPRAIQLVKRGQDFVMCEGCQRFLIWDQGLEEDSLDDL